MGSFRSKSGSVRMSFRRVETTISRAFIWRQLTTIKINIISVFIIVINAGRFQCFGRYMCNEIKTDGKPIQTAHSSVVCEIQWRPCPDEISLKNRAVFMGNIFCSSSVKYTTKFVLNYYYITRKCVCVCMCFFYAIRRVHVVCKYPNTALP